MTTLAAPNTATYTTTVPLESVAVVCSGATDAMLVSWVGPGGVSGQRTVRNTTSAGEEIGPLPNNTAVTFSALAGSPTFTAPAYSEPLQALVSGAGTSSGVLQIAGIGDSMTAPNGYNAGGILTCSRTNNVATLVFSGNHGHGNGTPGRVYNCSDPSFNTNSATITYLSSTSVSYPNVGPDVAAASRDLLTTVKVMTLQNPSMSSDSGYIYWLNAKTGGAVKLIANRGCNGHNSADMAARYAEDIAQVVGKQLIIILTGYNDFNRSTPLVPFTADQVYDNVLSMIAQSPGDRFVVVGAVPWAADGSGGTAATNRSEALKYNRKMRLFCNSTSNVRFADAAKLMIDATHATRFYPLAGMLKTDNIHPSPKGTERIAQAILDCAAEWIPTVSRLVSSNADNSAVDATNPNKWQYGPWVTSGGTANGTPTTSGTVSAGIQVTNTSAGAGATVASVVARSDGIGYNQVAEWTPALATDTCTFGSLGYTTAVTPGDTMNWLAELSLSGVSGSNLKAAELYAVFNTTPTTTIYMCRATGDGAGQYPTADAVLTLASPDVVVPVGATGCNFNLVLKTTASGTKLTAALGRMSNEVAD